MENRFSQFHPLVSFLFYLGAISLFILMLHPIFLGIGFVVILLINFAHDRFEGLKHWSFFIVTSFLLMVVLNPLFNERGLHVLFTIANHRFTLESVMYGGMNALSLIGVLAIFISYNVIMKPNKLLFLFSKFLPQFAVLLMLTLRFIPLMRRRMEEISVIQKSKGISVTNGKWKEKVKTGMLFVQALLTFSLEEAIQTADSMKARGFGEERRSSYEYFRFKTADVFAMVYLIIIFMVILYGRNSGYGFLTVYPVMESSKLTLLDSTTLVFFLLFLSFPLLVEAGGWFRWHISN